jgi:hypothetical protein
MDFKIGICRVLENIYIYKNDKKDLQILLDNTFCLYELVNGSKNVEFSKLFHNYWDFLEEINAIDKIEQYQTKIDDEIIPGFISMLCKYLQKD